MSKLWIPCLVAGLIAAVAAGAQAPAPRYLVGVVSEAGDIVTWLAPGAGGILTLDRVVKVDPRPPEMDGPHNITVAPDQKSYYVTISHGTPYGSLWRLDARTDRVLGVAPLEAYPTTIGLTPDGDFTFVANSDFYGDRPRVNPVSIVHTPTMTTIANLVACDMPHGAKSNHAGTIVYISCMHSDELLEVDVSSLSIARRIRLGKGHQAAGHAGISHAPAVTQLIPAPVPTHAGTDHGTATGGPDLTRACAATFVSVSPDDTRLFVACNAGSVLQVWDARTRTLIKAIPTGAGAYNVEPSPDGRTIIVTNKKDQSISVIDAATLVERKRIPVAKPIVHGVAYSPDGRYAYITQESVGADPGAVDVLDLLTLAITSSFPVPAQPTGVTILRLE